MNLSRLASLKSNFISRLIVCDDRAFFIGVIRRRPVAYIFFILM
nr:MAG TPA: hypothetical protein [Caudoviricetes sp.]